MLCSCCWWYRWQLLKDANHISLGWKSLHMTMAMDTSRLFNLNWFRTGKTVSIQNSSILEWPPLNVEKISPGVSPTIIVLSPPLISLTGTYGWHREGYKTEGHLKVDPPWQQKHLPTLNEETKFEANLTGCIMFEQKQVVAPKYLDVNGLNSKKHLRTHTQNGADQTEWMSSLDWPYSDCS